MSDAEQRGPEVGWRNFGWLWPYVRPQLGALAGVVALATFISVLATLQPYLSKLIIDDALLGADFPLLVKLCCLMVGLAIVAFAIGGFNRWRYVRVSGRILFALREDVYAHLLTLSPEFFRQHSVGDLVTRLDGDVAEVQRFSTDTLLTVFNSALLLMATAVIMTVLSWQLALVAAVVLPLQLALRHKARPWISGTARSVREQASGVTHFLVETLGAAKAVQGATAEDWERRRLTQLNQSYLERLLKQQLVGYASGGLSSLLSHCATAAVFIAGGYGVMRGALTIGTLVAFVAYMTRSTGSALSLLNLYTAYQRAAVSLERVEQLREAQSQTRTHASAPVDLPDAAGHLNLDCVTLCRDGAGRLLLDGASLDIAAGSKIVICGDSGVGKTTLADALRGFVAIQSGCIRLDGKDIGAYDLKELRRRVVTIEAEPAMFGGTLLHNLRYGNFDASEAAILAAARCTGVDEFVSDLPDGYGTRIGDGGSGISAGQKQRVALTRALLAQPIVLILDEATSHLDPAATAMLHARIDEHFAQQTRIVITHSPQSVPRADVVYDLVAGELELRSRTLVHG